MKRLSVCTWGLLLLLSVPAKAEPMIDVGRVKLMYGVADQEVQFFVTGGDPVDVLIFYVQVGDGGPELRDELRGNGMEPIEGPGIRGPHVTAIDLVTGTIFENNHLGPKDTPFVPQLRGAEVLVRSGTVPAGHPNGSPSEPWLVATVTFDASMWGAESIDMEWHLRLKNVIYVDRDDISTNFGDQVGGMSTVGSIVIVPEPSTGAILALGGLLLLLKVSLRRRGR